LKVNICKKHQYWIWGVNISSRALFYRTPHTKIGFLTNFQLKSRFFLESYVFRVYGTRNHFKRLLEQHFSYQNLELSVNELSYPEKNYFVDFDYEGYLKNQNHNSYTNRKPRLC